MKRLVRVASGIFAIVFATASSSATVAFPKGSSIASRPMAKHRFTRLVKVNGQPITLYGPPGCTQNGPGSFIGGLGPVAGQTPAAETNFAGGTTLYPPIGYAVVAGGMGNESCDYLSLIGGGLNNTIGGDNYSPESLIAGGKGNAIGDSTNSVIGGGLTNLIIDDDQTGDSPYGVIGGGASNTLDDSGASTISGGSGNTIYWSSGSVISGGSGNSFHSSADAANEGLGIASGDGNSISDGGTPLANSHDSFIGGGNSNGITDNDSAILGGFHNTVQANGSSIAEIVNNFRPLSSRDLCKLSRQAA